MNKIIRRRLTSQWSGRFRAAHFSAAHRRVRRQKLKHSGGLFIKQFGPEYWRSLKSNVLRHLFHWCRACVPSWHFLRSLSLVPRIETKRQGIANTELTLWLIALQAATARLKKKGQWSTFQGQVISASLKKHLSGE